MQYCKNLGLKEDNFHINITEGWNFNTGEQEDIRTADRHLNVHTGKVDPNTGDPYEPERNSKPTNISVSYHKISCLDDVTGQKSPPMAKYLPGKRPAPHYARLRNIII